MGRRCATLGTALLIGVLSFGCGGSPAQPSAGPETLVERLATPHFRLHAGLASDSTVRDVADRLEESFGRVTGELGVTAMRSVSVKIWQDEPSFGAEMQRFLGQRYAATGYVTGADEVRVLAVPQVARNATHEFCHAVSLYVNPSFGNNPRWLWETVALYENGERVDPRGLGYLVRGDFPTLLQLDADPNTSRQIYEVGYLIGEFIVERWGRAGLLRLIRGNGDVAGVLGLSPAAFEAAWREFVRGRYLS